MHANRALWQVSLLVTSLIAASPLPAQDPATKVKPLDLSYISDEYFAAVVIHPSRLLKAPALKDIPLESAEAAVHAAFGVDPRQLEQAIVLLPDGPRPVPVAAILRFSAPHAGQKTLAQMAAALGYGELAKAEHAGKEYYRCTGRVRAAGYIADRRTLIVGSESCVQTMMTTKSAQSALLDHLGKVDPRNDVTVVALWGPLTRLLEQVRDGLYAHDGHRSAAAPAVDVLLAIAKKCKSCELNASLHGSRLMCQLEGADAKAAEFLHDLLRGGAAFAQVYLPVFWRQMKNEARNGPMAAYVARLKEPSLRGLTVRRRGDSVTMDVELEGDFLQRAITLLEVMDEVRSLTNLRQLAISMHLFHDVEGRLPAHANYDKNGRPLLSWRVQVLPWMEQQRLHERFNWTSRGTASTTRN